MQDKEVVMKLFHVFSLMLTITVGCGDAGYPIECKCEDIDHCFEETKEDFFETYYSECVTLCEACGKWADVCRETYDIGLCIDNRWHTGSTNSECLELINFIIDLHDTETCNGDGPLRCTNFQKRV
jgi:hypothetical protein